MTKEEINSKLDDVEFAVKMMSTVDHPADRWKYRGIIETKIALIKAMIRDL